MSLVRITSVIACVLFLGVPLSACAQSLELHPVSIEIQPQRSSATLVITNPSDEPVSLQLRAFAWTQPPSGPDKLVESDDLIVSPPAADIAPGESQIIRVLLRAGQRDAEGTYRLLVDELPTGNAASGVRLSLHFSVPVFFEARPRAASDLHWTLSIPRNGTSVLKAVNEGGKRVRIGQMSITGEGLVATDVKFNGSAYVLGGAERRWDVPEGSALRTASSAQLEVQINGQSKQIAVPVVQVP
ncbi:fimbrial biogenesis chaperone [Paraburkholderia sp. ZP32-5]|uniref:fimbrial biogenesis chaperone n=1 Tax=Paraburkholderia sp. ZP32-5 TaxID=2883245 RepID=UPI001F467943|nr:fimbria/pilus periplasmic chaperone [Paraburkholderia sp. ZP32-5]